MKKIAVIGGGAAGLFAAARLLSYGCDVTLFERGSRLGLKLGITGKGRCNLTNACTPEDFFANVQTNPRFLYSCYNAFSSSDVMDYFESIGVPLKIERGNRVFPKSDKAGDIVDALKSKVAGHTVVGRVSEIISKNGAVTAIRVGGRLLPFDAVLLCTGGISYPRTGSTGDGYRMAERLGHTVITPKPSLVPIESQDHYCRQMQGLSLKNVGVKVINEESGKTVYSDFGEMMFTHFGVTGPMILSASSMIPNLGITAYRLEIDLKPALDEKTLDARLLSDFEKNINRDFSNSLGALLPSKMIPVFVSLVGIDGSRKINSITKEERRKILSLLKAFPVSLSSFRPIDEAIITKGGISVKEVDPRTMESKLVSGLYFAGEILDVDAYTGGFNLQIAFSTAAAAADSISENFG